MRAGSIVILVAALAATFATFDVWGSGKPLQAPASGDAVAWHHKLHSKIMEDMARLMTEMSDEMKTGNSNPSDVRTMSGRLRRMGEMMRLMAAWEKSPGMTSSEERQQMKRMRDEMDEMTRQMMRQ